MNTFVLHTGDPRSLLTHLAFYGLTAILEDHGIAELRMSWTPGMAPRPQLCGHKLTDQLIAEAVRNHAGRYTPEGSWLRRTRMTGGKARGLMSPRISTISADAEWVELQRSRHRVLDELTSSRAELDLRLLAALGEPAYWRFNPKGDRLQDDGASRLEMQPRNQGSEFVRNRLLPIGQAVAARDAAAVRDGLAGVTVIDEVGKNRPDSRSATGFTGPGPVDNALVWCALWGISQLPLAHQARRPAITSGHLGDAGTGWFYAPTWRGQRRLAWLRTILASRALRDAAAEGLIDPAGAAGNLGRSRAARAWLADRAVTAVVQFPVRRHGSDNAPERRAQQGTIKLLGSGR
jgi:CRISPR-associated protein Csb3